MRVGIMRNLVVLAFASLLSLHVAARQLPLEHMFFDTAQQFSYSEYLQKVESASNRDAMPDEEAPADFMRTGSNDDVLVPISAKANCKGSNCPAIAGQPVTLAGTSWSSVNNVTVYPEATSGWFFLWLDRAQRLPLVPSPDDFVGGGRAGYLKGAATGFLHIRG